MPPDTTVDGMIDRTGDEMRHARQQASSLTNNSHKVSAIYSERGKQRLDIKKIKMESKQFI